MSRTKLRGFSMAGFVVHTTYPHSLWLDFNKLARIWALEPMLDESTGFLYRQYRAANMGKTNPYRTFKTNGLRDLNGWIEAWDYPTNSHSGLEPFRYINYTLLNTPDEEPMTSRSIMPSGFKKVVK